ncbi:MAG: sulfurtransferase TusA family protein [Euryarchaeota archaeon]|nr:sulfurtransferase TusA family protein [Euryarchaeota archaeon]MDE1835348.1 sulfurtransferase TusA family protein [Euryarchaeota archaeon]MDE1880757.1 sulfurtransferase TusA family protein [Euryarchaeota archaeon]MDE2043644.1 sulfurtransferase TusA family protein [Thermoplasmata archaeon]
MNETPTVRLDCREDVCPVPVLRTKEAIAKLTPGATLEVLTKDPMATVDIPAVVHKAGAVLLSMKADEENETATFLIRRP